MFIKTVSLIISTWCIVRSNIELTDWVEKNFGKLERS